MTIREARVKAEISQHMLAELVGVTPAYISMLEKGKRNNPSLDILRKIAKTLGTSVDDILCEKAG